MSQGCSVDFYIDIEQIANQYLLQAKVTGHDFVMGWEDK